MDDPDPVSLVRVVNHLRSIGKVRAIEDLRAFLRYAPVDDQQRLCLIIPLLFVPTEENADLPLADLPIFFGRIPERRTSKEWRPFYISVEGDLPFHNVRFGGSTGPRRPDRGYLVEWADKSARLRDKPLRPVDDPLKAADDLCEKLAKGDNDNEYFRMHIRMQARRCLEHLLRRDRLKTNWLFDDQWKSLKQANDKVRFRWNEAEQRFDAE